MIDKKILLIFSALIIFCGTPKENDNAQTSQSTFFPLVNGSYWHYESYLEGEIQEGGWQRDSVLNIATEHAITKVDIARITAEGKEKLSYQIDGDGKVFLITTGGTKQPFCHVAPAPKSTIGDWHYTEFLDSNSTIIRLETADFESATYEEQLEWQGRTFRKGIGLVSFGGADLGMELVEYRIGQEGNGRPYNP